MLVSYGFNQSTLGTGSTILYPLNEVKGRKICLTVRAPFLQIKHTRNNELEGKFQLDSKVQVKVMIGIKALWAAVQTFSFLELR